MDAISEQKDKLPSSRKPVTNSKMSTSRKVKAFRKQSVYHAKSGSKKHTKLEKPVSNRVASPIPYLERLAPELQMMIFEKLGPATQRILGSTCKALYDVWKTHFYEEEIRVHIDELQASSPEYTIIMLSWVVVHWYITDHINLRRGPRITRRELSVA